MNNNKVVIYYRVSTKKQGEKGLGMEGQKSIVEYFTKDKEVLGTYIEVQSAKTAERAELRKAIDLAKKHNATLIVSKHDRLSRNVVDALTILDELTTAGASLACCDLPSNTDRFTLTIMFAVAERERELISIRTKLALAELKKDATRNQAGRPRKPKSVETGQVSLLCNKHKIKEGLDKGRLLSIETNKAKAYDANLPLFKQIKAYIDATGVNSLNNIAKYMNNTGVTTVKGGTWTAKSVSRILSRYNPEAK